MNKYLKWGFVAAIAAGASVFGFYQLAPRQNEELATADKAPVKSNKKILKVKRNPIPSNIFTRLFILIILRNASEIKVFRPIK